MIKTIELNEQQVQFLKELLDDVIGEDRISHIYSAVYQQILDKLYE